MSFIGDLLGGGGPQKAQVDKGATVEQATNIYGQQQDAIKKQQDFANAVAGQNGLQNQNSVYQQLAGIANGTGPSVAQNQLAQATQANVQNQAALMAGQRGASQNAGLIARQAAMQGVNAQQQAAGQMSTLRAQEQQNAIGQMGGLASQQVAQQQGALSGLAGTTGTAQSNILGAINGQNQSEVAATRDYNTAKQAQNDAAMKMVGGAIGGVATGGMSMLGPAMGAATSGVGGGMASQLGPGRMLAAHGGMIPDHGRFVEAHNRLHGIKAEPKMMSEGGHVPGQATVKGDSLKNDTQPTMLSPGEVVIPRSVMMSKDPVKAAADFVKQVISGNGPSPVVEGGKQKLADGGYAEPRQPPIEAAWDWMKSVPDRYADATAGAPQATTGHLDDASGNAATAFSKDGAAPVADMTTSQPPSAGGDLPIAPGQAPQEASSPQVPQGPQDSYGYGALTDATASGYKSAQAGIYTQADAEGKKAQGEASAANEQIKAAQDVHQNYQQEYARLDQERKGFQQSLMNGKIDPDHYLGGMSSGARAGTAIGLILGGISSGMTGQQNPALDYLNKQIDRDIDSQKANMNKDENLLKMNMQQFGNLHDATTATRAMLTDVYAAKLTKAGAEAGSEAAKGRAMQAAGELQMKVAPMMQQMAMRKAMMSGGGTPEMKIRMMVPEGQQAGVFKQLGEAQNMVKSRDNLISAFDQVNKLYTIGNTVTSPLQTGRQRDAIVKPLLAQLSKDSAGRFTEADSQYLESLFPARGDNAKTVALKNHQINEFVSSKMHFPELKAFGIDPTSSARFGGDGKEKIQARKIGGN